MERVLSYLRVLNFKYRHLKLTYVLMNTISNVPKKFNQEETSMKTNLL